MPALTHLDPRPGVSEVSEWMARYPLKFAWFIQNGYSPHLFQTFFHALTNVDKDALCRFRHLVAGRRGGKTMSAAWEVAYYVLHPEHFHWDAHQKVSSKPLHVWVVTKDFPTGFAALNWFREVLKTVGLEPGLHYKENKGNHWFEFENGSFVHFRSAEDAESLRGAGLDILWMDEAAFIPNSRPWEVSRPALSDRLGLVITTTTPDGKNWLYDEFWSEAAIASNAQGRVEYRSIDCPAFPEEEWLDLLETYHPLLFKQEYMASFDSMAGKELAGEWLKYYTSDQLPRDPEDKTRLDLDVFIGVDPAISLADTADRFAIAVVGVTRDKTQAFLLDLWAGRIPFAEQIDKIAEFQLQWRPQFIGVESVAFQAALVQQTLRLPGFLPIIPLLATNKKSLRILAMAPLFKLGRIRIQKLQVDFINEWLDYDSTKKNPKDDCLDAVEMALRMAGALLPMAPAFEDTSDRPAGSMQELSERRWAEFNVGGDVGWDDALGSDW